MATRPPIKNIVPIKPYQKTTLHYTTSDIKKILNLSVIYFEYIREGVCDIDFGLTEKTRERLTKKDIQERLLDYMLKNGFIKNTKEIYCYFKNHHSFSQFEDNDGCRKSEYYCDFIVNVKTEF